MKEKPNQRGFAIIGVLLLTAALLIMLATAMKVHQQWRQANLATFRELERQASQNQSKPNPPENDQTTPKANQVKNP